MKCNVGGADRAVRVVGGTGFLLAGIFADVSNSLRIAFYAVAAIALVTALITYCPLNTWLGINTCRRES